MTITKLFLSLWKRELMMHEYGAPCDFDPSYEYSQLNIYMSDDGSGFKLDYDLTTDSELMDLSLQLEFLYADKGLKSIFITVDPQ